MARELGSLFDIAVLSHVYFAMQLKVSSSICCDDVCHIAGIQ